MLVLDEARLEARKAQMAADQRRAAIIDELKAQVENAVYVENEDLSPANAARQIGRPMSAADLEAKLKTLLPSLHFEFNPFNSTKKALYHIDQRGKQFICAYEAGVMPEHSILRLIVIDVPDWKVPHLNRADMPKGEYVPGHGWIYDAETIRPGWKRVRLPGGEITRGWRTVLLKLFAAGLLSKAQLELVFGSDDRPEWAGHTGARSVTTPW